MRTIRPAASAEILIKPYMHAAGILHHLCIAILEDSEGSFGRNAAAAAYPPIGLDSCVYI